MKFHIQSINQSIIYLRTQAVSRNDISCDLTGVRSSAVGLLYNKKAELSQRAPDYAHGYFSRHI